ncbi:putative metal-binding protein [Metabacillus crassostreae]|uniref:hypothetical protein n=1 Tax=Metabacillus crassostreae TaxID=929098 RepID=UPI00195639E7|nr:hypothetical protein [Metabacillus crassostreae]MBM7603747.1 putative metal-binding protein [Metabacillus crassostreae]
MNQENHIKMLNKLLEGNRMAFKKGFISARLLLIEFITYCNQCVIAFVGEKMPLDFI